MCCYITVYSSFHTIWHPLTGPGLTSLITTLLPCLWADRFVSKNLIDSLILITSDFESKLNLHTQAINNAVKSYAEIAEKIQLGQDKVDITTEEVSSNAKFHSQAVASTPPPHSSPSPSYSQIQICNHEEIKKSQVLINFFITADLALNYLNEDALSGRALESLNT